MSRSLSISGGAFSISAELADFGVFAQRLRNTAEVLAEISARTMQRLARASASYASVLDPIGAAEIASSSVGLAAGCLSAAADAEILAALITAAGQAYREVDDLRARYGPLCQALEQLPTAVIGGAVGLAEGRPTRIIVDDPELADLALFGLSVAMSPIGAPPKSTVVPDVVGAVATLYRDGEPAVRPLPAPVASGPLAAEDSTPPRSAADLLRGLQLRNESETDPHSGGGMIDVRFVQSSGPGRRAVIVDLPGTTRWNVDPRTPTPQVSDFSTNLRALAGSSSVYEKGVLTALALAGVTPSEPVMLVGHSEGGLIAARIASDINQKGRFNVTHVVTAGAPIGLTAIPAGVSVLALENRGDVVPHLDGRSNPSRPNWITATASAPGESVDEQHAVASYVHAAADLDASTDRSVLAWKVSAGPFLQGDSVTTKVYQISRKP